MRSDKREDKQYELNHHFFMNAVFVCYLCSEKKLGDLSRHNSGTASSWTTMVLFQAGERIVTSSLTGSGG